MTKIFEVLNNSKSRNNAGRNSMGRGRNSMGRNKRTNRKTGLVLAVLIFALLTGACNGLTSPSDTIRPPQSTGQTAALNAADTKGFAAENSRNGSSDQSKSLSLIEEFNQLKDKNSTPGELLDFIKPQAGNLDRQAADNVVKTIIDVQELQLKNYNDKMTAEDFNVKLYKYEFDDLAALNNIKDEEVKTLLRDAYKDGYKLSTAEGMHYLEIDYNALRDAFSQYTSDEMAAYLNIMAEESSRHFAVDAAITISLDQLADRVVKTEAFIAEFKNSRFIDKVRELHKYYLNAYLLGLDNTPAYKYEDNKLKPEVMENFRNSLTKYSDSELADILKDYIELIEKSEGKKTKDILNFVSKAVGK